MYTLTVLVNRQGGGKGKDPLGVQNPIPPLSKFFTASPSIAIKGPNSLPSVLLANIVHNQKWQLIEKLNKFQENK